MSGPAATFQARYILAKASSNVTSKKQFPISTLCSSYIAEAAFDQPWPRTIFRKWVIRTSCQWMAGGAAGSSRDSPSRRTDTSLLGIIRRRNVVDWSRMENCGLQSQASSVQLPNWLGRLDSNQHRLH